MCEIIPIPSAILAKLNSYVIGQDRAKRKIAGAIYEHCIAHFALKRGVIDSVSRNNLLFIGPTGTGKTLIAKSLAKILDFPFVQLDLTKFSSSGYVGAEIGSITKFLIQATMEKRNRENAIVFLDEFDKIAGSRVEEKDVSGYALQAELLKIMEEGVVTWTDRSGKDFTFDLSGVFFIFAGAFPGLSKIIRKRLGRTRIGFSDAGSPQGSVDRYLLSHATPQDFEDFGFLPEIMGRIAHIASLEPLREKELNQILVEAKGSPLKQTKGFFKFHGIQLDFSDKALLSISKKALAMGTGARGLPSILGNCLDELRFSCPELHERGVQRIRIVDLKEDGSPVTEMEERKNTGEQGRPGTELFFLDPKKRMIRAPLPRNIPTLERILSEAEAKGRKEKKKRSSKKGPKTSHPRQSEEAKSKERKKVKLKLFDKIKEDEATKEAKVPLVSTGTLISWFMNLYEKEGKAAFEEILERIQARGETLSMFHLMREQSNAKKLDTIWKYWDYWDALQNEKRKNPKAPQDPTDPEEPDDPDDPDWEDNLPF
ncbi:MAG TPA: AAA family ATPase [Planctomycetes bacterium]|nr:AAA family ATPase [Planctomycetota bacterium]